MASMERSSENEVMGSVGMARCLVVMSKRRSRSDAFECKTCHREFSSFQALGGHRASHKRPRLLLDDAKLLTLVTKPKMHECTICGLEFSMGQALGGHMRRHRALLVGDSFPDFRVVYGDHKHREEGPPTVMMRRSTSCNRRVFGLDLNLTPLENDLVLVFGNMVPNVIV